MKRLMLALGFMGVLGLAFAGTADAKKEFRKATGLKCSQCHEKGKSKKEPSDTPLYKKAKAHMKKGKACMECHQGHAKPPKKDDAAK